MFTPFFKLIYAVVLLMVAFKAQQVWPYRGLRARLLQNMRNNLSLGAINAAISALSVGALLMWCATWAHEYQMGLFRVLDLSFPLQLIGTVLVLDLLSYAWHVANHRSSFLWRFHAVHHSDNYLDASSAYRFHLGEVLLSTSLKAGVIVAIGLPLNAVGVYETIFAALNIFEHADCRLSDRIDAWLSLILVTPALHRKHHTASLEDQNRNFSTIFSFWDRLFGTYQATSASEEIEVGLNPRAAKESYTFYDLILLPFKL